MTIRQEVNKNLLDVNKIIDKLISFYDLHTDAALTRLLGVNASTVAQWRRRNRIDLHLIVTRCHGINLNWLLLDTQQTPQHQITEPTEEYHANEILSRQSNVAAVYDAEALRKKFEADLTQKLEEREQLIEQNRQLQERVTYLQGQVDAMQSVFAAMNIDITQKKREAAHGDTAP